MRASLIKKLDLEDWLKRLQPYWGDVGFYLTQHTLSAVSPPPSSRSYRLTWKVCVLLLCLLIVRLESCQAEIIRLSAIEQIESSSNPNAIGDQGHSIGLYQISKGLLTDFNTYHKTDWTHVEMRSPDQAEIVALWAFQTYFPTILKRLKKPTTTKNLIVCWSAGCGKVNHPPLLTKKYLKKYKKLGGQL